MNYTVNDEISVRFTFDGVTLIVGSPPAWLLRCNLWDQEVAAILEAIEGPGYPTRQSFQSTDGVQFGHLRGVALLAVPCERSHPTSYGPCPHPTHTFVLDPEDVLRLRDVLCVAL